MGSRDQTHVVRFDSRHPHRLSYLIGSFLVVEMVVVMEVVEVVVLMVEIVIGGGGGRFVCVCLCEFAF